MSRIRQLFLLCLSLLGCILCGCEPEQRFAWSPDGERALVRWEHQVRLVNGNGEVLSHLPDSDGDPGEMMVTGFDWFPEGDDIVVSRLRVVKTWEEARPLLPISEAKAVEAMADHLPELVRVTVAIRGSEIIDLEDLISLLEPKRGERALAALALAWTRESDAIVGALAGATEVLEDLKSIDEEEESGFLIHELVTVALSGDRSAFAERSVLSRSLRGFQKPRCSPDGVSIAVGRTNQGREVIDLEVVERERGKFHPMVESITAAYDWAPDGRSLVFLSPVMEEEKGKLMQLQRLPAPGAESGTAQPKRLAMTFVPFAPRVEVLASGEVLFAGQPLTLPYRGEEPRRAPRLFTVPLEGGDLREVPTEAGSLPMDLGYFVPSPDGKRIAVVESQTDALAVIDLETGDSKLVSSPHRNWKCRTLPAWKNDAELTYAALEEKTMGIGWMRWEKGGAPRSLSKGWPAEATAQWLHFDEPPTD